MRFRCLSIITILTLALSPLSATEKSRSRLPFKLHQGFMIVVRATAGESTKLRVQIETGDGVIFS